MKRLILLAALLVLVGQADAQNYPTCGICSPNQCTSCTVSVLVTTASTPIFPKNQNRMYLEIQNVGFVNLTPSTAPVCCAIGTNNHATWDANHSCNGFMLYPNGQNYEPSQLTAPQTAFRVPSGDVACISPAGNQTISGLQE